MKYFLAYNEDDVFHYGKLGNDQEIKTGQPILKFFNTIDELNSELSQYGKKFEESVSDVPLDFLSDLPSI